MTIHTYDDGDMVNACRALHDEYAAGLLNRAEYLAAFNRLDRATGVACDHCGAIPATIQRDDGGGNWCSRCHLAARENRAIGRRGAALSWLLIAGLPLLLLLLGVAIGWAVVAGVF